MRLISNRGRMATDRRGEHMHQTRWRKTRDTGQSFERKVPSSTQVFAHVFENAGDSRVNLYCPATIQQIFAHPAFHVRLS